MILSLVMVAMFVVIFTSLAGLVNRSYHQTVLQAQDERALRLAEAGLDYARWRLAHNSTDYSPATRTINDQFAGTLGEADITFTPPANGGSTITITSVGKTTNHTERQVTLQVKYGQQSLARYALITNSDVWFSGEIAGATHANGGIRMDGQSDSLITSGRATYTCKPIHNCNNETKPGIWGTGGNQALWQFPVTAIDYTAITASLLTIKQAAQNQGKYYGPSGVFGYHLVFNTNGTYTISKVTQKDQNRWSYDSETGWEYSSYDIKKETVIETKPVPSNGVIYVEDTVWVEGTITRPTTVAAGVFPDNPSTNVDIIMNDNITYGGVLNGSRSLGIIAQRSVLIPYGAGKKNLTLQGALVAQKGKFERRYYDQGPDKLKDKLSLYGMIASNGVPVTAWVDNTGAVGSGFAQGESIYDPNLLYGAPPYFPTTGQFDFLSWHQVP